MNEEIQKIKRFLDKIPYWVLAVVIVVSAYALFSIDRTPDTYNEIYVLENQYIGDIAGYEDCLIMVVAPVNLFNNDVYDGVHWEVVGNSKKFYFGNENTLLNISDGDIIIVRWADERIIKVVKLSEYDGR